MKINTRELELKAAWLGLRAVGNRSRLIGGALADHLWFTPWEPALSESALSKQRGWLADTEPFEMRVEGRRIAAFTGGKGPVVLLVHGWADRAATMGAFIAPLIASGRRVVGVDLPAHGDSSGRRTDALQIAEVVRAVSDRVGGLDGVLGHSMGAHGTMVAMRDGLRPRSAVFLAPSIDFRHTLEKFVSMIGLQPKAEAGLRASIERRFGTSIWEDFRATNLIRDVDVPTLVLHDWDDDQIDVADSETLVEAWPSAQLERTRGLGHAKITRDPDVIARAVGFLTAHVPAAAGMYARV